MRQLRRQALRLRPGSLPAMVDVLAHGSDAEVTGAFNILYQRGARIDREGDTPQSCRYRVTLPDGSVHTVQPDNLIPEDFEDDLTPPDEGPAVEGIQDLAKSWRGEAILALVTAVMVVGALETKGVAHVGLIVAAVCTGALLAWSLFILTLMAVVMSVIARIRPGGPPDNDDSL